MNALPNLLLITALSIPTSVLILRSGDRIAVDGPVTLDRDRVLFRAAGALYSVPALEVDLEASRSATTDASPAPAGQPLRLKVTAEERERLLRALEENHSGTAASSQQLAIPTAPTEASQPAGDEWSWRRTARGYEETVRHSQEELDLLVGRAAQLKAHIAGLLSLGYKPEQFSYDTTQLAYTVEQIPRAELEVQRAQRAYDQFRDDARRQGVLPGWIR